MIIMSNDVIILIKKDGTQTNDVGDIVYSESRREIFVEVKSVGRSEFYQAMAKGLKPEIVFVLEDYEDYENETELEYNSVRYKILKTYKTDHRLELTCYGGVFNANA